MALVSFARAFQRHIECPDDDVPGATLGPVLTAYFERHPGVRSYVLDDTGGVRKHVTVFIDATVITDRRTLSDSVAPGSRIDVFQALSGG